MRRFSARQALRRGKQRGVSTLNVGEKVTSCGTDGERADLDFLGDHWRLAMASDSTERLLLLGVTVLQVWAVGRGGHCERRGCLSEPRTSSPTETPALTAPLTSTAPMSSSLASRLRSRL